MGLKLLLKLSPSLFFLPQKSFFVFFWKLFNFWPEKSLAQACFFALNFFFNWSIFCPKNPGFLLKLSPSLFFGPFPWERWYFGSPASIFPFLGILSRISDHFSYMLRNGLGNKTCFILLGIILFYSIGNEIF